MWDMNMREQAVTFEQVIAHAQAAMDGADALQMPLAGNHIAAGLDMLRAAQEALENRRESA
jgi:hypothetical protein